MNKLLFALVAVAVVGVGIFLLRKYNKVKPVSTVGYTDVNGTVDKTRDTTGNSVATATDSNTYQTPLSFKSATDLVQNLKIND